MREVVLTVGPRGSGKTDFCKKTIALNPSIVEVSRDDIMFELFGGSRMDPYCGGSLILFQKVFEAVENQFKNPNVKMILDAWNGNQRDRQTIITRLRNIGANRIVAWYFTTPEEIVEEWFWKKPGIAKSSEIGRRQGEDLVYYSDNAPRRDCGLFHQLAESIDSDGFDRVVRIDPLIITPVDVLDFSD